MLYDVTVNFDPLVLPPQSQWTFTGLEDLPSGTQTVRFHLKLPEGVTGWNYSLVTVNVPPVTGTMQKLSTSPHLGMSLNPAPDTSITVSNFQENMLEFSVMNGVTSVTTIGVELTVVKGDQSSTSPDPQLVLKPS